MAADVDALLAGSQALHERAAELVGRNDHTLAEYLEIRGRVADVLLGEADPAARLEISLRVDDPEQCVRVARLLGTPALLTVQDVDGYRYAAVEPSDGSARELFLVLSSAEGVVAVLPLDADTLQWEDALRGGDPQAWLEELTALVRQDADAVAAAAAAPDPPSG